MSVDEETKKAVSILDGDRIGVMLARVCTFACVIVLASCGANASKAAGPSDPHLSDPHVSQIERYYDVLLVPALHGATVGWCLTVVTPTREGCEVPPTSRGPIFVEGCKEGPSMGVDAYALTTSRVASVSVDGGPSVRTRRESSLPPGLRAVVVEIANEKKGQSQKEAPCPRFTPFNAKGQRIVQTVIPGPRLQVALPGRKTWELPAHPPYGPCAIRTFGLAGYTAKWGSVASRVTAYRGAIGNAFLSCVSAEYFSSAEISMSAAVLLNASHPGTRPAPLPDIKPLPGHPGVFQAQGSGGELLVRDIGKGWLVVEEGVAGLREPLILLEHLRATVHL
jgi:hypothetical protein